MELFAISECGVKSSVLMFVASLHIARRDGMLKCLDLKYMLFNGVIMGICFT